jgi:hypothetical protein
MVVEEHEHNARFNLKEIFLWFFVWFEVNREHDIVQSGEIIYRYHSPRMFCQKHKSQTQHDCFKLNPEF